MIFQCVQINWKIILFQGQWSSSYLYFRKVLKFDEVSYSRFISISGIINLVGKYIVVPFLSKKMNWRDSTIALAGKIKSMKILFNFEALKTFVGSLFFQIWLHPSSTCFSLPLLSVNGCCMLVALLPFLTQQQLQCLGQSFQKLSMQMKLEVYFPLLVSFR